MYASVFLVLTLNHLDANRVERFLEYFFKSISSLVLRNKKKGYLCPLILK
jgi:hypothetical protein